MTARDYVTAAGSFAIESFEQWSAIGKPSPILVAADVPEQRRRLVERLEAAGARFASLVQRTNWVSPNASFGEGTIALAPFVTTTNSRLGRFVIVLPGTCIGHDVTIGDFVTVGPSANVAGFVEIGEGCTIGARAVIVNGTIDEPLRIGSGATIADDAVVTKDVRPGWTVGGNPARRARMG